MEGRLGLQNSLLPLRDESAAWPHYWLFPVHPKSYIWIRAAEIPRILLPAVLSPHYSYCNTLQQIKELERFFDLLSLFSFLGEKKHSPDSFA